MKKSMVAFLAVVSVLALFMGGCAKKQVVKSDDEVLPITSVKKIEPAKPDDGQKPLVTQETRLPEEVQVKPAQIESVQPANSVTMSQFETAYFDYDKSELRKDTRDVLSKNAEIILKSLPTTKIQIEGHCDERGSAEYNMALGENRAKSAQKYLTTLGVKAENLSIISYGKEKPAIQGSDETAWAKNRRAEFVVVK